MNTDTGERMPIDPQRFEQLKGRGFPVTEDDAGPTVLLPDPVFKAEQVRIAAQAKARRRKSRKQADRSRRAQRRK